jgi:hypothetical protein
MSGNIGNRFERGACWRMVNRDDGYRKGSPTGCPEPVRWTGNVLTWGYAGRVRGSMGPK